MRRSLDLLPADFVLAHTVAEWRRFCTGEGEGGSLQAQRVLGTSGTAVEALGDELGRALRKNERQRVIEPLGRLPARSPRLCGPRLYTMRRSRDSVTVRAVVALADGDFPPALRL